jgi:formylmethanofuran dehydrogenase subunit E
MNNLKENYFICEDCGKKFCKDDMLHTNDNKWICKDCYEENYFTCEDCGEIFHKTNMLYTNDDSYICEGCYEQSYFTCEHCGEICHQDNMLRTNDDKWICEDCYENNYFICDDCGEICHQDNMSYTNDDRYICEDCYEDNYFTCEDCGEVFREDYSNEYNGYLYCQDCYEEICENCNFDYNNTTNRINMDIDKPLNEYSNCSAVCDYHDNPINFEFRKIENEQTDLYFGVELEITNEENKTAKASHFVANNLFCRIEKDSSINNYGFEIISDPATLNFWNNRKNKIKQVFEELTKNGYISHNDKSCGLHIHASRQGLGDTMKQIDKTINNLILICENFKKELQIFSRRETFNWCHFLYDDDVDGKKETNIEKIKNNKGRQGRYSVINLNNSDTIEFRLNRGTLNINTFYASLQLFYNMIELAKKDNIAGITWCQLINMNDFNELKRYNKERKIKGYNRIKETSELERIKEINEDLKAIKKREKSLPTYRKIQEFRFDMLQKLDKYGNITNNEFYSYCVNSGDRDTIYERIHELKRTMSDLNNYIINNTFKRYCQNNDVIYYYVFDKTKIIELENNIIQAYNNYINLDVFQYIFKDSNPMELIKTKKQKGVI